MSPIYDFRAFVTVRAPNEGAATDAANRALHEITLDACPAEDDGGTYVAGACLDDSPPDEIDD